MQRTDCKTNMYCNGQSISCFLVITMQKYNKLSIPDHWLKVSLMHAPQHNATDCSHKCGGRNSTKAAEIWTVITHPADLFSFWWQHKSFNQRWLFHLLSPYREIINNNKVIKSYILTLSNAPAFHMPNNKTDQDDSGIFATNPLSTQCFSRIERCFFLNAFC